MLDTPHSGLQMRPSHPEGGEHPVTLERSLVVSYTKFNTHLLGDPTGSSLGIYPRERKTYVRTETCRQTCMAALFVRAKNWNQPSCPSAGGGENARGSLRSVGHYSAVKRRELLARAVV